MSVLRRRCSPYCANFHTPKCPKESGGGYQTLCGEEPLNDTCWEERQFQEGEKKPKIDLVEVATAVTLEYPMKTDRRTYTMYRYCNGVWTDDAESFIHSVLVEVEGNGYVNNHLKTLTEIVQAMTFTDSFSEPPPHLINVQNGILDIKTMELHSHSKDYFFRNMLNVAYDPEATCPKFLAWLSEVLPNEDDREFVRQMFGYCFYRDYPYHKIFFLVGTGRNGKGTLMRTLKGLIGAKNYVSVPLERLGERFQATNLVGKLVNVVSEPKISLLSTEIVKQLTGQDQISGEIKGKQKLIEFTNYAKIIVLANKLPPVRDDTVAWWDRVAVVEFPMEFKDDRQIPNIEERWLSDPKERSGILNWAISGLKSLLEKGFIKTKRMEEIKEIYQKHSRPVQYFISKYCEIGVNKWIPKSELYFAYKQAAENEGFEVVSEETFGKEVRKIYTVKVGFKRIGGKNERVWLGISLRDTGDASNTSTILLQEMADHENKEKKGEEREKYYRNTEPVSLAPPVSGGLQYAAIPKPPEKTREEINGVVLKDCCLNCGEYEPEMELCRLHNSNPPPSFVCQDFRWVRYRCVCGAGPWRDQKLALEHAQLCGEGHKIIRF